MKQTHLARSAALLAASVSGVGSAVAADLAPVEPEKDFFFSMQVGALEGEAAADKLGLTPDDEFGITGAVAFGRDINQDWDWRLRIFGTQFHTNSADDGLAFIETDLDYVGGDVEFGRTWGSQESGTIARAFLGIRALHAEDELFSFGATIDSGNSDFTGAGPRIGAEFAHTFGTGTFGISGGASAAWLLGQREHTYSFDLNDDVTEEDTDDVFNLDAYLGLDWHPQEKLTFTAGYMVQAYWNIRGANVPGSVTTLDEDSIAHGPFVKAQYGF